MNERAAGFDAGPLNWLWPELEQALGAAAEALPGACAKSDAALATARTHLHRISGAIRMAGLPAVVPFVEEMENVLAVGQIEHGLTEQATEEDKANTAREALEHAIRALAAFLYEVRSGAPVVVLKVFPQYARLQRQRGIASPNPVDLFRPDLDVTLPLPPVEPSTGAQQVADLAQQRRVFQAGLLAWLRGDQAGVAAMRDAVVVLDGVTADPEQHAFWWIVAAWLDALATGGLAPDVGAKQLAGRIDAQIRRAIEGSSRIPERLRCEVLYQIALSATTAPGVRAVQRAFRLSEFLPATGVPTEVTVEEPVLRGEALRIGRETISRAKEAWPACAAGNSQARSQVNDALVLVTQQAQAVGDRALARLVAAFGDRLLSQPDTKLPESLVVEGATCLLFIEAGLADEAGFAPDAAVRVDTMLARLDAVAANLPLAAAVPPPPRQPIAKQPRERALVARVAGEVRVNLARIEAVLDGFFRDSVHRDGLSGLARAFEQAQGALRLLGLDEAEAQLDRCAKQVDRGVKGDPLDEAERSQLAEALSRVDLYLQLIEQQRPGADRVLSELHLVGEAPASTHATSAVAAIETLVDLRSKATVAAIPARIAELVRRVDELRTRADAFELNKDARSAQTLLDQVDEIIRLAAALRASIIASPLAPTVTGLGAGQADRRDPLELRGLI